MIAGSFLFEDARISSPLLQGRRSDDQVVVTLFGSSLTVLASRRPPASAVGRNGRPGERRPSWHLENRRAAVRARNPVPGKIFEVLCAHPMLRDEMSRGQRPRCPGTGWRPAQRDRSFGSRPRSSVASIRLRYLLREESPAFRRGEAVNCSSSRTDTSFLKLEAIQRRDELASTAADRSDVDMLIVTRDADPKEVAERQLVSARAPL